MSFQQAIFDVVQFFSQGRAFAMELEWSTHLNQHEPLWHEKNGSM